MVTVNKIGRDGLSYELSGLGAGFRMTCPQYPPPVMRFASHLGPLASDHTQSPLTTLYYVTLSFLKADKPRNFILVSAVQIVWIWLVHCIFWIISLGSDDVNILVVDIRGCIQKFRDWPPGTRTTNGTALCH